MASRFQSICEVARHRGPVFVDTNVILESYRVGSWRALTGGYGVETVEVSSLSSSSTSADSGARRSGGKIEVLLAVNQISEGRGNSPAILQTNVTAVL